jgi:hypothetical protein
MKRLWVFCICVCLASCSNPYGDHPPYPTTGQILVNGKPAEGARLVFHHLGDWGNKSIVPQAMTKEDGRFTLTTYQMGDGAPAGEYRVVVEWPAYRRGRNIGPDRLQGKFANPDSSGLTAHVEKGKNELPALDLKAEVGQFSEPGGGSGGARRGRE